MLINLSDCIGDLARSGNTRLNDFVEDLFAARRRGRHVIFSSIETLDALQTLPGLSNRTSQAIQAVKARQRAKRGLLKNLPGYINVMGKNGITATRVIGQQKILDISFSNLNRDTFFQDAILLVENESDGILYQTIGEFIAHKKTESSQLHISLEVQPGGGSQTPRRYRALKNAADRFVLCIVDSDREHPTSDLGTNVAGPIMDEEAKLKSPFVTVTLIDCYSIENLIPAPLIQAAHARLGNDVENEDWYRDAVAFSENPIGAYVPLKNSQKCSILRGTDEKSTYWLENSNVFRQTAKACKHWGVWHNCRNSCDLYKPISKKTLETVIEFFPTDKQRRSQQLTQTLQSLPQRIEYSWDAIAREIIQWGCSGERLSLA